MDKQALRERIWDELEETGEARFPFPPHGRIPNFAGASEATDRLGKLDAWQEAQVIKSNPDAPQLPVRRAALHAGKTVYMAVPRLKDEQCFLKLDPAALDDIDGAATIGGSAEHGVQVHPEAMEPIDLIVSGSVAVDSRGSRIGKGEGYSDLEFALLREFGRVDSGTTTVSTVHELQVVDERLPVDDHDVPIEYFCTPERTLTAGTGREKPNGIDWDVLSDEKIAEIPILEQLAN